MDVSERQGSGGPPANASPEWDVIVVGAGMGGATAGHRIAQAGFRVLFVERGRADPARSDDGWLEEEPDARLANGHWPDRIAIEVDGDTVDRFVPLGCGAGGSTRLYAAALERFARSDVDELPGLPHPTGGWPLRYHELQPYYEQAERLYRVRGTRDPLSDPLPPGMGRPPPPAPTDGELFGAIARAGLHPYRLHIGIDYRPGCTECLGFVCATGCKADAESVCLRPALERHGARLVADAKVLRLHASGDRVTGVEYRDAAGVHLARARTVVLAAGSYHSPAILLSSASPEHPAGIGNAREQVGRNLMFHSSDWFALWPERKAGKAGPRKTIGFRDTYVVDGVRLGGVQSTGLSADYGSVLYYLHNWWAGTRLRRLGPLRHLLRIPARIATRLFGDATLFVMIIEDFARAENRVMLHPDRPGEILVKYRLTDELKRRTTLGRRIIRERLKSIRKLWVRPDPMIDFGHATGTLRFGTDPGTSVLDPDCRVHGMANLWVADGSFMPSSGGVNPSLTIAAMALRVGDRVAETLGESAAVDGQKPVNAPAVSSPVA